MKIGPLRGKLALVLGFKFPPLRKYKKEHVLKFGNKSIFLLFKAKNLPIKGKIAMGA